jgi:outer membrane receptor protein involved in Fe transport
MFGSVGFDYVFKQSHLAPGETVTPAYKLIDATFGLDIAIKRGYIKLSLIGKNLLGEKYYDHLSRLKGYTDYQGRPSVYNIGRNIMLNVAIPLSFNYSKQ